MTHISDIKLIRTDTTLDLSQKAEKGMLCKLTRCFFYSQFHFAYSFSSAVWDLDMSSLTLNISSHHR
uniref:Uncharacterized protein n=1 Tax=Cajanus cajan TaxID=3821 RepID=A0A151S2S5_CAJCA|nr:hypothetical protein KK1_029141 [Cajanus cajan]